MSQYPPPPTSEQTHYAFYSSAGTHSPARGANSPTPVSQSQAQPGQQDSAERDRVPMDRQHMKEDVLYPTQIEADAYRNDDLTALAHHTSQMTAAAVAAVAVAQADERNPHSDARGPVPQPAPASVGTASPASHHPHHPQHQHHPHQHPHPHQHHPHGPIHDDHASAATAAAAALSAVGSPHLAAPSTEYGQLAPLAHMGGPVEIHPPGSAQQQPGSANSVGSGADNRSVGPDSPRPRANRLKKACDSCSIRKVKCDESGPPCKACEILLIPCTFNRPSKRRGPPNKHAEAIKKQRREEEATYLAAAAAVAAQPNGIPVAPIVPAVPVVTNMGAVPVGTANEVVTPHTQTQGSGAIYFAAPVATPVRVMSVFGTVPVTPGGGVTKVMEVREVRKAPPVLRSHMA